MAAAKKRNTKTVARPAGKRVVATKPKRNMFAELMDGMNALREEREGKRTLRTYVVSTRAVPDVKPAELIKLREGLELSRPVFADYLRTNPRTLENWEQGRAKPNAQAALLIRLVQRYPDTVQRLAAL
jgi:putative transcriptional regulator